MTDKRFYWLKLRDNFFDRLDIKAMRMLEGGGEMVIIYMKMLLSALNSEGKIIYSNILSSCEEEIAIRINEDTEKVHKTLEFLIKTGQAVISDNGDILLTELAEMEGSESSSAQRVRKSRKNKALQCNENVTADIEKEKEKDTDKETDKETENTEKNLHVQTKCKSAGKNNIDCEKIIGEFNNICKSLPRATTLNKSRKKKIEAAYTQLGGDFTEFFRKIENSDFLTGRNGKWKSCFDWVLKPENLIKILEGNYDNNTVIPNKLLHIGDYTPTYSIEEFENESVLDYYA